MSCPTVHQARIQPNSQAACLSQTGDTLEIPEFLCERHLGHRAQWEHGMADPSDLAPSLILHVFPSEACHSI